MPASIQIAGRLGSDPELKTLDNGTNLVSFRLATKTGYRNGEDVTTWFDVALFGKRAESLSQLLFKGRAITVFGELSENRVYTRSNGDAGATISVKASDIDIGPMQEGGGNQGGNAGGGWGGRGGAQGGAGGGNGGGWGGGSKQGGGGW
jgi:single-strand DNA-binding protein